MRYVRPSYVRVTIEGRKTPFKGGPASRAGEMSALFLARMHGAAVPFIGVEAIASDDGATVTWRIVDKRTQRVLFTETVTQ